MGTLAEKFKTNREQSEFFRRNFALNQVNVQPTCRNKIQSTYYFNADWYFSISVPFPDRSPQLKENIGISSLSTV